MLTFRKLAEIGQAYRDLKRYNQIIFVLVKYGFGDLVETLRIDRYIRLFSRREQRRIAAKTRPEKVRMALEELGPTFIKFGQIISTRPDLIPMSYARELEKLQDKVPAFPYEEVRKIIIEETGKGPDELFKSFDVAPFAAASIGQVHKAELHDGSRVVVKVQRPGMDKIIEVDLEIMHHLAGLMERHLKEFEIFKPREIVEEFARCLEKEIDYTIEAGNMERFRECFKNDKTIHVPAVCHELSTRRMLTMEYIDGIKATNAKKLEKDGYDLKLIARNGCEAVMRQVFVAGVFHGDPHPGNIHIMPGNVICLLDFGLVGRVSLEERESFADLLKRLFNRDERKAVQSLLRLTTYRVEPDLVKMQRDMADLIDEQLFRPLKDMNMGKILEQILEMLSKHRVSLRPNLFLMIKAIVSVEKIARSLDSGIEILNFAGPHIKKIYMRRISPKYLINYFSDSVFEAVSAAADMPQDMRNLFGQMKKGDLKIQFEHVGLNSMIHAFDRNSGRVSYAIVLAALIVGSSLITLSKIPPRWGEIPVIGLAGFVISGIMGFWMLLAAHRRD
jgi:ubiquinone biosynthesis protein